jgi:hypothetical protein
MVEGTMTLESSRRLSAIRHANSAFELVIGVRDRWTRNAAPGLPSNDLKQVTGDLGRALDILRDERGAYWDAAEPLMAAARVLLQLDWAELEKALQHANLAYAEISEHRPTSGSSTPT